MSYIDFKSKRTDKDRARKLIAEIVLFSSHNVGFTEHALKELSNDQLTTTDAWNVLKSTAARIYDEGELKNGSYRYRLETSYILLVITFWPNGSGLTVVTAWDKRRRGRN